MENRFLPILTTLLAVAALQPVFCASLEELVGAERAAALRTAASPITEAQHRDPRPRIMPSHEGLRQLVSETVGSLDPSLFVETLSLYRPNRSAQGGGAGLSGDEQTSLFNQLVALSTLSGIQYYSESRKAMRTLFEYSHVIDSPTAKNRLPDPVFAAPPAELTLHARQKDLTFGDNTYRFDYRNSEGVFFLVQENLTSMNVGIIPAVGKNKYRLVMAVIAVSDTDGNDAGDSLLIYAAAMAKAASFPGMGERVGASFSNRVEAGLRWFQDRADGIFQ
jgi:hypothetical protein